MQSTTPDAKTIASLVLTACGEDDGTSPIGAFDEETPCLYGDEGLADLQPAEGTDYVALREAQSFGGQPPEEVMVNIVADWGRR